VLTGGVVLFTDSRHDCLTAVERQTGEKRWVFRADGPIRFAPAVWGSRVYVASDDGRLYCLSRADGRLLWSFQGAPGPSLVLGNERLISAWPARGAPVVASDGDEATVYFAAGIWPFLGVFLYALDARTGEVRWCNSGDGASFIKQPHSTDAFAGVAPQGSMRVSGDYLLVAGGRSLPAVYNRHTGKLEHYLLNETSKKGGGPDIDLADGAYLNGGGCFDLKTGKHLGPVAEPHCAEGSAIYSVKGGILRAFDLARRPPPPPPEPKDAKGKAKAKKPAGEEWLGRPAGSVRVGPVTALTADDGRVYAGAPGQVLGVEGLAAGKPSVFWQARLTGTPAHIAVQGSSVTVSTREGGLFHFDPEAGKPAVHHTKKQPLPPSTPDEAAQARRWQKLGASGGGYAVIANAPAGAAYEMVRSSSLRLIFLEEDAARAASLREALQAADIPGGRAAVLPLSLEAVRLPPYLCSLLVLADLRGGKAGPEVMARIAQALRPFGGVACLPEGVASPGDVRKWLHEAEVLGPPRAERKDGFLILRREGGLPGGGGWTHEHADAANTRVSPDRLVKAPLGLLWFGGPGNQEILPRHGHGPMPQSLEGRVLIEGMDSLRAIDAFTGRLLWKAHLPGLGTVYDNLAHQPGANAVGSNYASTPEGVFVAHGRRCLRLDPETGKVTRRYTLPKMPGEREDPEWTFLSVTEGVLIGAARPAAPSKARAKKGSFAGLESSRRVTVIDLKSGKPLWSATAQVGFRHNGIAAGAGMLCLLDREPGPTAKGEKPKGRIVVHDLRTGRKLWEHSREVFGTWLGLSREHGVLVEAGMMTRDTLRDEAKGMRAFDARTGKVLWHEPSYFGPPMLHGRRVLKGGDERGGSGTACDLLTGKPVMTRDPLTGDDIPWRWQRTYGCNTPGASESLVLFRSGAAGFYDLENEGGTGNLGGIRSSCTLNLIPAGGVLVVPDYTRTCTCSYQNQTSAAFVHQPDVELWTFTTARPVTGVVRRVGVNLGAPGSRKADDGTLWLEHPPVGGPSPKLAVSTSPAKPEVFRLHSSQVNGKAPAWVAASGALGLEKLTIPLGGPAGARRRYTVRLYFLEPEVGAEARRFTVTVQGKAVEVDLSTEAGGGPRRGVVREVEGVEAGQSLVLTFSPGAVLSGVEAVADGW
jgi:outer membrane protein assembly factor BamB